MGENCNVENIGSVINTSVRPPGEKIRVFQSDGTGMRVTMGWKGWGTLLVALLAGGGGVTGFSVVTGGDLDEKISKSEQKQTERVEEVKQEVEKNRESINDLTATVKSVQEVQHIDVAHREARRVVEEQMVCNLSQKSCRRKRTEKIERLRRINMKRLKDKRETCDHLDCYD